MTNANTIQAKRKFKNRWPFKQVRVSEVADDTGADAAFVANALDSFVCCADSTSFGPTTLRAIEQHISQVLSKQLQMFKKSQNITSSITNSIKEDILIKRNQ